MCTCTFRDRTSSATLSVNAESAPFEATYRGFVGDRRMHAVTGAVEDAPPPAPGHSRQDGERPGDRGEEIRFKDPTVEGRVRTDRRQRLVNPSHIGQDLHTPAVILDAGQQRPVRLGVGEIAQEGGDSRNLVQGFRLDVDTEDPGPPGHEVQGDLVSDTRRSPGDNGDLAVETLHRLLMVGRQPLRAAPPATIYRSPGDHFAKSSCSPNHHAASRQGTRRTAVPNGCLPQMLPAPAPSDVIDPDDTKTDK